MIMFLAAHIILLFSHKLCKEYGKYCLNIILWSIGFTIPKIIDKRRHEDDKNVPPIIVFQHSTFADGYILLHVFGLCSLKFLVKTKHIPNPIVKKFTDKFGCIPVDDSKKTGVTGKIQEYIKEGNYTQRLIISPEGGRPLDFDNNDGLSHFSSGAFVPLVPIQPVLIQFTCPDESEFTNPTWNTERVQNDDSIVKWYFSRFFVAPCEITITLMEEAVASEGMTPKEYAKDVRNKMLTALK